MLQLTIGTIAFVALSVYVKIDEVKKNRMQHEYDETDWNNYYENIK